MSDIDSPSQDATSDDDETVRYAVIGLGWFAQAAILPAFDNAEDNSELVALVSSDQEKLDELGERYDIDPDMRVSFDGLDDLLASGEIDAVYIATPNDTHHDLTLRAARAGVHVLCEKPLAVTEAECEEMIEAARENDVRLMTAYRLHFEESNLEAIDLITSGEIGEARFIQATFSNTVSKQGDIRLNPIEKGGGTLYDIGVYCVNAARYLFRDEPVEVIAMSARDDDDPRFADCDEMTGGVVRFPDNRLFTFTTCFSTQELDCFEVLGTEGRVRLDPAFEFHGEKTLTVETGDKRTTESFPDRDHIGPEILYFSDCILEGETPEPSGREGLADVRVIRALLESARTGKAVKLEPFEKKTRPDLSMEECLPPLGHQDLVNVEAP